MNLPDSWPKKKDVSIHKKFPTRKEMTDQGYDYGWNECKSICEQALEAQAPCQHTFMGRPSMCSKCGEKEAQAPSEDIRADGKDYKVSDFRAKKIMEDFALAVDRHGFSAGGRIDLFISSIINWKNDCCKPAPGQRPITRSDIAFMVQEIVSQAHTRPHGADMSDLITKYVKEFSTQKAQFPTP